MDILLFNQYFTVGKDSADNIFVTLPINLLYLASYLEFKGINCKIYELGAFTVHEANLERNEEKVRYGKSDAEIIQILEKEKPLIVGISCIYSRHYVDIINISKLIKSINNNIKIVVGGNHATAFHNAVIKEPSIDIVVRGEGDITFYELCQKIITGNKSLKDINGITYKDKNNNIIINPLRDLVIDLNDLPPINYELVDVRNYLKISYNSPYFMRYPGIGIITSRGCPGNCIFCTVKVVWGRTWRARSVKNTIDEIELLYNKYGVKEFAFLDDSASVNKKRWNEICEEIIKRRLNIKWTTPNGIAHWTLTKNILIKMKKAGCYRITFGIESGNLQTRNFIRKDYSLHQAKEIIQIANRLGMWTISTNIIGFPYETKESINDTINFAKKSGTDFATFYLLWPMVTSDVYNYFKKENLLNFDNIFQDNCFNIDQYNEMDRILSDEGASTKYFTAAQLKGIQIKAYRNFFLFRAVTFLNPIRILSKIKNLEDFKYTVKLGFNGIKLILRTFHKSTSKSLIYKQKKINN